ncbi:MAG: DinB family protein [Acidobacteria bacterium]|nr:DinB family protein [Acidobacteriota bacterium]
MKAMKQILVAVSLVVMSAMAPVVIAQQGVEKAAPGTLVAPAEALTSLLNMTESQMMSLVKAFPADKYGFAPSAAIFAPGQQTEYTGVRTFGALVIHVAQANYALGSKLSGLKPEIDPATLPKLTSKDEIVAALEASFAFDHKAIGTLTTANAFESVGGPFTRSTQAAFIVVHASDEYGQMVEYLRMNGIAPPASGATAPPKK